MRVKAALFLHPRFLKGLIDSRINVNQRIRNSLE